MGSPLPTSGTTHSFQAALRAHGLRLRRAEPRVLQLNIGKLCNLACVHCHVNAGPWRREVVSEETITRVIDWVAGTRIPTIDLTGGAPEMAPGFRRLVESVKALPQPRHVIDRCNLTILLEPGYEDMVDFLAAHEVEIIASMPCYSVENVDAQRGEGVFDASIKALQLLNEKGYGKGDERLPLHLVYNPGGAFLPPEQAGLEADYKREMQAHFGITFDRLYCLANLPIARFASYLKRQGEYEAYLELLANAFNPATVEGLMCRETLSVSWEGRVYDCDFNQMLDLPVGGHEQAPFLWDLDADALTGRAVNTGEHCFGCTAGAGSSCGGSLA